ncbi:MAG: glutathione S-transferase N-terminal domain-containing protein [Alphaproteobacteria bacterium]|mgnify:CR=1 FL=1
MQLIFSPTSPFVRKVWALALETGLAACIERITLSPAAPDETVYLYNPLSKVPALTTSTGLNLFDSPVICEYLDSLHKGPKLYPPAPALWASKRREALADGLMDAAVLRIYEGRRPANERSPAWIARQTLKTTRALDTLESEAGELKGLNDKDPITIGEIAVGCALGFLDFRFEADRWQDRRPALAAWWTVFSQRPCMKASRPVDPAAQPLPAAKT